MQWWNDLVRWFSSEAGWRLVTDALVPFVAILIAGIVAALIARGAVKRVLATHDRERKSAAIGALVNAARQASVWDSLTPQEQLLSDRAVSDADVQLRLLPVRGSGVAADWAAHEILEFKRGSATFGYQFDTLLVEFRDRLIDWQRHPGRGRKIFASEISRWDVELSDTEKRMQSERDARTAEQHSARYPASSAAGSLGAIPVPRPSHAAAPPAGVRPTPARPVPAQPESARPVSAGSAPSDTLSYLPTDSHLLNDTGATGSMATGPLRTSAVLPQASASPREVEAPDEDFAALPGTRRPGGPAD